MACPEKGWRGCWPQAVVCGPATTGLSPNGGILGNGRRTVGSDLDTRQSRRWNRVGRSLAASSLPHHRTYGPVSGGSWHPLRDGPQCLLRYKRPVLPCGFRPLLPTLGPLTRHLLNASRKVVLASHVRFSPSPVGPATTASADFCRSIPPPRGAGSTPVARGGAADLPG